MITLLGATIIGALCGHPVIGLLIGIVVLAASTPPAPTSTYRRRHRR